MFRSIHIKFFFLEDDIIVNYMKKNKELHMAVKK